MKPIPFYPNTKDNLHCLQAVLRMVLKHFEPEISFNYKSLDQLTAHVKGKGSWPTQGFINLSKRGYKLIFMDDFDNRQFIDKGEAYLIEKFGPEVGQTQINMSDIPQERKLMKKFIKLFPYQPKLPQMADIKKLLGLGYLVMCNVNYYPLYNKPGYNGHFVIIYDFDDRFVHLHDPGLPPNPKAKIPIKYFLKAWEYPDKTARNLCAVRKK